MHELSIAVSLIDTAQEAARAGQAERVECVRLRLGALSGVDAQALRFSFEVAAVGTLLEGAILEIEEVPIELYCPACARLTTLEGLQPLRCAACGQPTADMRHGRELELVALEVPDVYAHA